MPTVTSMLENLKSSLSQIQPFTDEDLEDITSRFVEKRLRKKDFLLREGEACDFVAFMVEGCLRHYYVHEGEEQTCYISFENEWISDIAGLSSGRASGKMLQALHPSRVLLIHKKDLEELYHLYPNFASVGRIMAERLANLTINLSMLLTSLKPEERYQNLLEEQPEIFQRVPQKYIASMLGIKPESLSRIRKRLASRSKS